MADKPDSPFNGPFSNKWDDEMSTESVSDVQNVHDSNGRLIGQSARSDEPTKTGWVARTAWYAEYGYIPGQITGWAGPWPSRTKAEAELRTHAAA